MTNGPAYVESGSLKGSFHVIVEGLLLPNDVEVEGAERALRRLRGEVSIDVSDVAHRRNLVKEVLHEFSRGWIGSVPVVL